MSLKIYYDRDIDLTPLVGRTVAVIGYGAQGQSHALNLRDSGVQVVIGQRPGNSYQAAVAAGFEPLTPSQAAAAADVVCLMVPDEVHAQVFRDEIRGGLVAGNTILCCHGFSFLYGQVIPPADVHGVLVAPKGAGHMVRSAYQAGGGVPCYVGAAGNDDDESWLMGLAYAKAIGGGRVGVMKTTIAQETETDLFGEQAVLCGGMSHLAAAAFETLIEAGYPEEMAYFECVHELKLVVDLLYQGGLSHMRQHISNTAEYGDYITGPRVVDEHTRQQLREILADIQSGRFARQWLAEAGSGGRNFAALRKQHRQSRVAQTGRRVQQILRGEAVTDPHDHVDNEHVDNEHVDIEHVDIEQRNS